MVILTVRIVLNSRRVGKDLNPKGECCGVCAHNDNDFCRFFFLPHTSRCRSFPTHSLGDLYF